MRIKLVVTGTAGKADLQVAAAFPDRGCGRAGRRAGAATGREQAACAGHRAGGGDTPKELAPVRGRCPGEPAIPNRSIHETHPPVRCGPRRYVTKRTILCLGGEKYDMSHEARHSQYYGSCSHKPGAQRSRTLMVQRTHSLP